MSSARADREEWKNLLQRAEAARKLPLQPIPDEQVKSLLTGGECTIPIPNKMVRVFTSSTFSDTEMERNSLMKDVYPYLRKLCSILGMEFNVVDMRWGVRKERTNDHGTSELCMSEVAKCLNSSFSIAFVAILGDKYGYRPFPTHIGLGELDAIKDYLKRNHLHPDSDLALLDQWYMRDDNNIPPRYVLRPISDVLTDESKRTQDWKEISCKIQTMLRNGKSVSPEPHKYVRSVTEEEIFNGILNNKNAGEQALCFDRRYTNLRATDGFAYKFRDMIDNVEDTEAIALLDDLKKKVHKHLPETCIFSYSVDWQTRPTEVMDAKLDEFLDQFCRRISTSTLERFEQRNLDYTPLVLEAMHHSSMLKDKYKSYVRREDLQKKMDDYLNSPASSTFVVYGESGCGKTSFMANSAYCVKQRFPEAVVVTRFIGTSPQSSNARSILYSIACQITKAYGGNIDSVSKEFKQLAELSFLSLATSKTPLFIFLDSLDQMVNDDNAWDMSWMPDADKLPEWVHLVVSTLPKEHGILQALESKYSQDHNNLFLKISILDVATTHEIIISHLSQVNRTLSSEQLSKVRAFAEACPSPLYIKMLVDICSKLNSYEEIGNLPTTIKGLINEILAKLERDHGTIVVSHALAYITCAKNGLTENELEDILACDDEVITDLYEWWTPPERRMPPLLWARISSDLAGYLVMRGSQGHSVYAWYHRQWIEAAHERYLKAATAPSQVAECTAPAANMQPPLAPSAIPSASTEIVMLPAPSCLELSSTSSPFVTLIAKPDFKMDITKAHIAMADYFNGKWGSGKKKPYDVIVDSKMELKEADRLVNSQELYEAEGVPNIRKLSELPYHQIRCEDYKAIADSSLGNISFISAKIEAGLIYEMIEEYLQIGVATISREDDVIKEIQLYSRFIKQNAHTLKNDPKAIFQLALNQPNDSTIYCEALSALPKEQFFVEWINKSPFPNPTELTIEEHDSYLKVKTAALNLQSTKLFIVNYNCEALVYDLRTGAIIVKVQLEPNSYVYPSFDGSQLFVFFNQRLLIYNTDSGALAGQTIITIELNPTYAHLYATSKNIIFVEWNTVYMLDIPTTTWASTTPYRKHEFPNDIADSSIPAISSTGIVLVDMGKYGERLKAVWWYWGTEDKDPIKIDTYDSDLRWYNDDRVCTVISSSGKYLAVMVEEYFKLFDFSDKHNVKLMWIFNERILDKYLCFSRDETKILMSGRSNINYTLVHANKNKCTAKEDIKILAEVSHTMHNMPFMEISPGRFFHANHESCKITNTGMKPLERGMMYPVYSTDGKSMMYYKDMGKKMKFRKIISDLSGKEPQEVYTLAPRGLIVPLSPSFNYAIYYDLWEKLPKVALCSVMSSDPIFVFQNSDFVCMSPDETLMCVSNPKPNDYRISIVPIAKTMSKNVKSLVFEVAARERGLLIAQFSNSNRYLLLPATIHGISNLQLMDLKIGKTTFVVTKEGRVIAFSPDEKFLAIACDHEIILYNLEESRPEFGLIMKTKDYEIECMSFSHDSQVILFGLGAEVRWCSVKDGTLLYRFDLLNFAAHISTTPFSNKILLGDGAGVLYYLTPAPNRKLDRAYSNSELHTFLDLAQVKNHLEVVTKDAVSYLVEFVHRVRDWLAEARIAEVDEKKVEEKFVALLALKTPPHVTDIENVSPNEHFKIPHPAPGPGYPLWSKRADTSPQQTFLPFAAIAKAVTSAIPTPFFSERGKMMLAVFGKRLIEIHKQNSKSLDYAILAKFVEQILEEVEEKKRSEHNAKQKAKQAERDSRNESQKEYCEVLKEESDNEEDNLREDLEQVPLAEHHIETLKVMLDQLKVMDLSDLMILTKGMYPTETNQKWSEKFARDMHYDIVRLADKVDLTREVIAAAKEFEQQCPGYFLPGELDLPNMYDIN